VPIDLPFDPYASDRKIFVLLENGGDACNLCQNGEGNHLYKKLTED